MLYMTREERQIQLEKMVNTRDLGGYETQGGMYSRAHKYIRAAAPTYATSKDIQTLKDYGVQVVIDLRSDFEKECQPNPFQNEKDIDEYFDFMPIEKEDRDKLMKDYSHGMKNKMQMLVNIIAGPNILLLDEPLTSFDVVAQEEMKQMFKNIKKDHIIIFSTHIMELALDLCDEIVVLNKGILKEITKDNLDTESFKNKIIEALKEE